MTKYTPEHPAIQAATYWTLEERRDFAKFHPTQWAKMLPHMPADPLRRPLEKNVHREIMKLQNQNRQLALELQMRKAIVNELELETAALRKKLQSVGRGPGYQTEPGPNEELIKRAFALSNLISVADLDGVDRTKKVLEVRQALFWYLRTMYGMSFPAIGRLTNKNHSTVIHGVRLVNKKLPHYEWRIVKAEQWMIERAELHNSPYTEYKALDELAA